MNFDLTDDQRQIQRTAREFLADRYRPETIRELTEDERGFTDEQWSEISELGWPGVVVPEEQGGLGLGTVDLCVICEELGYALAPSPFLSTVGAGMALAAAGSEQQRRELLEPIASGEMRGTLALFDVGEGPEQGPGAITMEARSNGNGATVLEGEKALVMDAATADVLIVGTADGARHVVPASDSGVTVSPLPTVDATRKHGLVRLDGVEVPAGHSLPGGPEELAPVRHRIEIALAAELVGVAQRALEMSVSYAKDRHQFGRPIGSFQAVSHVCAQMMLEVEGARALTYYAAWTADHEPASLPLAASQAKAFASDAGVRVTQDALQVHGGIGFTWEHDLHLWLKRARADAVAFGSSRWHRERVAELAGL